MANNLAEVFKETSEKFGENPAFWSKDENKEFKSTTYRELYQYGLALAESLIELGVKATDNIGLLADNRLEWIISDYGIILAGAANVPRGSDITDSEIVYILNHSEAKIVFLENDRVYEKFTKNRKEIPDVKTIVIMDPKTKLKEGGEIIFLQSLLDKGKQLLLKKEPKVYKRLTEIRPDFLFTLIYTSGTTGMPKGVMLTHANMMHQLKHVVPSVADVTPKDRMLSILPVWHIFERVMEYFTIINGAQTYYTKVTDLRNDIVKVKPTYMASAPRVWESIYTAIYNKVNDKKLTPPVARFLFKVAYLYTKVYQTSTRFFQGNLVDYEGRNPFHSLLLLIQSIVGWVVCGPFTLTIASIVVGILSYGENETLVKIAGVVGTIGLFFNQLTLDAIVLSKIRLATGGKLKASLSGGGALQRHVDEFFNNIGITVLEGYGMTETAPVISTRNMDRLVIGSVGPIVPLTELQIRDDHDVVLTHIDDKGNVIKGELGLKGIVHVKGPQVMKGYYKNEEATNKVLVNGWMNTGDIGFITFNKTLTLKGRAKDTIVLLGGENVEPVPIEHKIEQSIYIHQVMVIGQDQKVLGAIIVPDFEHLIEWAKENGIQDQKPASLVENPKVIEFYKKEVRNYNSVKTGFKAFEQVQLVTLITKVFEVGDELTNSLKVKRHVVNAKYEDRIKALYKES
jgi:long-chain acyl-CoA synthetase